MSSSIIKRSVMLMLLFVKEQLKEPVALFWMIVSPATTYYLLAYLRGGVVDSGVGYWERTSWFYAYISSSVALFGFSFYIVGRRESGFIRSFIYTFEAKLVFMLAQFLSYSLIAIIYCSVFYALIYFSIGSSDVPGLFSIVFRFFLCYVLFSVLGILLSLLPINFQNAGTVFSIASFVMLVLGVVSIRSTHPIVEALNVVNPLFIANKIMTEGVECHLMFVCCLLVAFVLAFLLSLHCLRINPVWSRY